MPCPFALSQSKGVPIPRPFALSLSKGPPMPCPFALSLSKGPSNGPPLRHSGGSQTHVEARLA